MTLLDDVWLDDPVERIVRLVDVEASPADKILSLAGGKHQDVLAHLEDQQAKSLVTAYRNVQKELNARIQDIYGRTFGSGIAPEPKHVVDWARSSELLRAVDGHLEDLGLTTQAYQQTAWSAGAQLGLQQAKAEMGLAAEDFGMGSRVAFGRLDNVAYDLGMTAAINETQNLAGSLRAGVHEALTTGAVAGEGIRGIQQRVDAVLNGATNAAGNRAEMISRYAVIKGHNAARSEVFADAAKQIEGLKQVWVCGRDDRSCLTCVALHGTVIDAGGSEEFDASRTYATTAPKVYGGVLEHPPRHPRCRCVITAWHERWRGLATMTPDDLQAQGQQLAVEAGAPAKTFPPPVSSAEKAVLRRTRAGRAVIRSQSIASVPEAVRAKTIDRLLQCWVGGGK